MTKIDIGNIKISVVKKDIKNIHLSVYPPNGRVHISAPLRMNIDTVRVFAISKLSWIKRQQKQLINQERETPREYIERESHYLWGKRYLLKIVEHAGPAQIELKHSKLILRVRSTSEFMTKENAIQEWYRGELREEATLLISKWESLMGVKSKKLFIRKMKTKWGSCNPKTRSIRLNTELAKKPREYLEYIIVHELTHLIEPTHNQRFINLMDKFMPKWKFYRENLNQLPIMEDKYKEQ